MPRVDVEQRRGEAGFSIIEGLIAAALLLIVTVGILPLFSRAMQNNVKGNDSTRQANGATDDYENTIAMPFNSGVMNVPSGATSAVETRVIALQDLGSPMQGADKSISSRWVLPATLSTGDTQVASRQRTLRQFALSDFDDNSTFDTPLNGDTQDQTVIFKIVDLVIDDPTKPLARPYQLRLVQAF